MGLSSVNLVFLMMILIKPADGCPLLCKCTYKEVNCKRIAGDIVPPGIPTDTVIVNLENNLIKKITKNSFRHLKELKVLKLSGNMIHQIDTGSFDDLQNLMKLDLTKNHICELPVGIFSKLESLEILYLSDNKLENVEGIFGGLKNLQKLSIEKNHLTEISNKTFDGLETLQQLKLSNNNISNIHSGAFQSNQKLMMLAIESNPLETVDNLLQNNLRVQFLDLAKCQLNRFPLGLPWTVKYLKLSDNNITRIAKAETLPYTFISVIVLENNNLTYVEKGAFSHMGFLTDVFLIVNNLDSIPGPFPQSVRSVYLDRNKIRSISMESFQHGTSLSVLSLRSNEITEIQSGSFANLRSLQELHLERNPIRSLHNMVFLFVRGLQYITLNRLHLQDIYPNCFLGLDSLQKLEMSYINIEFDNIYGNLFYSTPNLKNLIAEESPSIAKFLVDNRDVLASLSNLTAINLMYNELTTIPSFFQTELVNLQEIKLTGNPLTCDTNLIWLRKWLALEPEKFHKASLLQCHSPEHLRGRSIIDVPIEEFQQLNSQTAVTTQTPIETTTLPDYYHYDYETSKDIYNYYDTSSFYEDYDDHYDTYEDEVTTSILDKTQSTIKPSEGQEHNINTTSAETGDKNDGNKTVTSSGMKNNVKSVGIAAATSVAVVVAMLLIAGVIYCLWKKKHRAVYDQTHKYKATDDYVFIVSKKDTEVQPKVRKLTREERGSTTSKASEDITNAADPTMKVYTFND